MNTAVFFNIRSAGTPGNLSGEMPPGKFMLLVVV